MQHQLWKVWDEYRTGGRSVDGVLRACTRIYLSVYRTTSVMLLMMMLNTMMMMMMMTVIKVTGSLAIANRPCDYCITLKSGFYTKAI